MQRALPAVALLALLAAAAAQAPAPEPEGKRDLSLGLTECLLTPEALKE